MSVDQARVRKSAHSELWTKHKIRLTLKMKVLSNKLNVLYKTHMIWLSTKVQEKSFSSRCYNHLHTLFTIRDTSVDIKTNLQLPRIKSFVYLHLIVHTSVRHRGLYVREKASDSKKMPLTDNCKCLRIKLSKLNKRLSYLFRWMIFLGQRIRNTVRVRSFPSFRWRGCDRLLIRMWWHLLHSSNYKAVFALFYYFLVICSCFR